jgi:protein tyrosine phosphatase
MALDLQRAGIISSATRQQEKAERLTVQIIQHMRKSRPSMVQGKQQAEMIAALIQKLSAETSR